MQTTTISLFLPWEKREAGPQIVPFFLPFRGCPKRCLYCAQDRTTGLSVQFSLAERLSKLEDTLAERKLRGKSLPELAFYGGTFTALPEAEFALCLDTAKKLVQKGCIARFRCSTRPDALAPTRLSALRAAGCTTVELGIQSFYDAVLAATQRGYTAECARTACGALRAAGFRLGVQLLPGLPTHTPSHFLKDVRTAIGLGADFLRFYPCLVLRGTELARMYRNGTYAPWDLQTTLDTLAVGYLCAKAANVPVIRMGLAPQDGLLAEVVAGPFHPALGARVQARALFLAVQHCLRSYQGAKLAALTIPLHVQGFFWGQEREMAPAWASLGLLPGALHRWTTSGLCLTLLV